MRDNDDEPSVMGAGCFYGPGDSIYAAYARMRHEQDKIARQQMEQDMAKARLDAMVYGSSVVKMTHVPMEDILLDLGCDSGEVKREVKMFKTKHPVSGIPTDDAERKRYQAWTFLTEYFPDSFLAVVEVAIAGNEQHNPGQPLHWARGKSKDQLNSGFKHLFEYGRGVKKDTDGQYHLAKAIWRLSAQLQLDIEAERNAPLADQDGPGEEDGPWAEGFAERSRG